MKPKKILSIIGTRPEAIKLAPVVLELRRWPEKFIPTVCVTAQHRHMLDQILSLFRITPDDDLNIMTPGQSLAQITARAVEGLDKVICKEKPDMVLVQGDTTTALCGALAAFYHKVKIGHVEAGLRTRDLYSPFPEEANRQLVGRIADYHFAPTERARQALLDEGTPSEAVSVTGNTVIDALLWVRQHVKENPPTLPKEIKTLKGQKIILVTGHRRESFGGGFENICHAIREIADQFSDIVFIYPMHLNPNVREPVQQILGNHPRIFLIEPLAYAPFVWLMDQAFIVLTDSGGVQEEAPSLGKPVLVMRDTTERPEGIEAGNAILVGTQKEKIILSLTEVLQSQTRRTAMTSAKNPYGDGKASAKIVTLLAASTGTKTIF